VAEPGSARLHLLPLAWALVVFGTAVPVELRAPLPWSLSVRAGDVGLNLLLYLPLGLCWAHRPLVSTLACGALLSAVIEFAQAWYFGRHAALADVVANALGAGCGALIGRWPATPAWRLPLDARTAVAAAIAALLLLAGWLRPAPPGTLSDWDTGYAMQLGNEVTGDRPWRGTVSALALVPGRLSHAERQALARLDDPAARAILASRNAYLLPSRVALDGQAHPIPAEAARRFAAAATQHNAFSVIATIVPENVQQSGPARVLSYSSDTLHRNLDLGQEGARLVFRVRTPLTGLNGNDRTAETGPVLAAGKPATVVASFDGAVSRIDVNGQAHARRHLGAGACVLPGACDTDLPLAAAAFGASLAMVAVVAGRARTRRQALLLGLAAAWAGAWLLRSLAGERLVWLGGWGAPLMVLLGAACVALSFVARMQSGVRPPSEDPGLHPGYDATSPRAGPAPSAPPSPAPE
jgi:VanZ family protein